MGGGSQAVWTHATRWRAIRRLPGSGRVWQGSCLRAWRREARESCLHAHSCADLTARARSNKQQSEQGRPASGQAEQPPARQLYWLQPASGATPCCARHARHVTERLRAAEGEGMRVLGPQRSSQARSCDDCVPWQHAGSLCCQGGHHCTAFGIVTQQCHCLLLQSGPAGCRGLQSGPADRPLP